MIEELKIIISAEIDGLKNAVKTAKDEVSSLSKAAKKEAGYFSEDFKKMGESAKAGLATAGQAMKAASVAVTGLMMSTSEWRSEQAKLNAAFEAAGASAEVAKSTYNDLYRVLGDAGVSTEAANHLAKLTTNQEELSEWTTICQGVYATFGASLPIEGLTEAINHTAKLGSVQGPLADALEWVGITTDEFNEKLAECRTEEERSALIRDTLTGLYEDAALAYEKNAEDLIKSNEAQAKFMESLSGVAAALQPVVSIVMDLGAQILTLLLPAIEVAAGVLEGILNFAKEYPGVLALIAGAIATVVAGIQLYNTHAKIKKILDAGEYKSIIAATSAYIAKAAAMMVAIAPYVAIVAAIAAVIAIIVLCIKHWDEIKKVVSKVWDSIKSATSKAVKAVSDKFGDLKDKAVSKVESLRKSAVDKFEAIKKGITDKIHAARDAVKDAIEKIKGFFNFKWELPKLKVPTFSMTGKFSLNPPSVPKISINWNALGGIFDKPTVFGYGDSLQGIGEDGAEAVVPLEKNTEWLDRIAERLAAKQGSTPIILQVDGKTFAQTSINTINQLTRQTGKLSLNIM